MHLAPLLFTFLLGSTFGLPVPTKVHLSSGPVVNRKNPNELLKPSDYYQKTTYTAVISEEAPMQFDVVATPKDNEKLSMFFNAWNTVNQVYEQNVKEYIAKTNEVIRVQNDDFEKLNKVVIESFIGFGVLIILLVAITIGFCFYIKYRS